MSVQVLLIDDGPRSGALEATLREKLSLSRARTLEGALELLRWFDHRAVVVNLDGSAGTAPPDAWPFGSMPPIVTFGGSPETRSKWQSVTTRHVPAADAVVAALQGLLEGRQMAPPVEDPETRALAIIRTVLDGALDGCVLVGADHTIEYATALAEALLGDWGALARGKRLPPELRVNEQQIVTTQAKRSIELRVGGTLQGLYRAIWVRDVTDQVRSGDLERRLLHSDRLASMGQLAAGVAHEVNNPAAFVAANLSMMSQYIEQLGAAFDELGRRGLSDARLQAHLASVLEAYQVEDAMDDLQQILRENLDGMGRISTVVRDLRNFSRIEESQVELVHPNEIVNSACSLAHNHIRHRAQLIKDLGQVPAITADRNKLVQVLMNLLMNAAQATPDGDHQDHFIRVATEQRQGRIHISVIDNGTGIPESIRSRIFEPFFTTKPKDRGTGLGLALCADIIRQHGGDIEVRSEEGEGSCFIVRLPTRTGLRPGGPASDPASPLLVVSPAASPESKPAPSSVRGADASERASPGTSRRGSILLVDDEIMLLRAFSRALAKRHRVQTASSGEEALRILRTGEPFDVIVCDLMMPGIDGIRVYDALDEVAPNLKDRIIFCSGGAFTPRARAFCERVPAPFLEKPLRLVDLLAAIERTLGHAASGPNPPTVLAPRGPDSAPDSRPT